MKIVKWILGIIGLLIAVLLIIAAIVPKDYNTSVSMEINKSRKAVYDYVVLLKNQDNYSVWASMDPDMKKTYKGTDGTIGFVSRWESEHENVGTGEQEIKNIRPYARIDYELRFIDPFESTDHAWFSFEDSENGGTIMTWGINGTMDYPMNLMIPLMNMEEMLAKDFSQGLSNLKEILE